MRDQVESKLFDLPSSRVVIMVDWIVIVSSIKTQDMEEEKRRNDAMLSKKLHPFRKEIRRGFKLSENWLLVNHVRISRVTKERKKEDG